MKTNEASQYCESVICIPVVVDDGLGAEPFVVVIDVGVGNEVDVDAVVVVVFDAGGVAVAEQLK